MLILHLITPLMQTLWHILGITGKFQRELPFKLT
jgi:hypothetical protein